MRSIIPEPQSSTSIYRIDESRQSPSGRHRLSRPGESDSAGGGEPGVTAPLRCLASRSVQVGRRRDLSVRAQLKGSKALKRSGW